MPVAIDYNLRGAGWATCTLDIDGQRAIVDASYLSDRFAGFLAAIVRLLDGQPGSHAAFDDEPGQTRWWFTRTGSGGLRVRLLWFDETFSTMPDERGETIYDAECDLVEFADAASAAASDVSNRYSPEEYRRHWKNAGFPARELAALEAHLRDRRGHQPRA